MTGMEDTPPPTGHTPARHLEIASSGGRAERFFPRGAPEPIPPHRPTTMPCLAAIIALLTPRILIVILWFFTTWFTGVFDTVLWPILGLIFLPTSLLWYSAVVNWFGGAWTLIPIVGMVLAVLIDLGPATSRRRTAYA